METYDPIDGPTKELMETDELTNSGKKPAGCKRTYELMDKLFKDTLSN